MKKNIFKVLACVLAVTLTLSSTGYTAFAAEPGMEETDTGTENDGVNSENKFTFSVADLCEMFEVDTAETIETVETVETVTPVETAKPAETVAPTETVTPAETAKPVVMAAAPAKVYARTSNATRISSAAYSNTKTNSNTFVFSVKDLMTRFVFSVDDLMDKFINNPKEPEYVTVSTYYCNCSACFHTTDYNALKQHMLQHVLRGERNSYHTVVEKVKK